MSEATDTPAGTARARAITAAAILATVIQTLDSTIANVALPKMQGTMGATQEQISWVLTSYIVATAVCMPLTGWLAGRFGRKRIFVLSVVGFTLASMACGAAQSLEQIVLFRLMQGAFGAPLVPLSQSVLLDTWPRHRHNAAMAAWGIGVMVGPIIGPTLGGWLTEHYDWRWVFYINLPVGIVTTFGLLAWLPASTPDHARRFDATGFAFLAIGLGTLQLMLDRGTTLDWFASPEIVVEAAIAALGLYLFVAHVLTHPRPFIEPALFADRSFTTGLGLMFMVGMVLLATMALLPPFLQNLLGYPVIDVGTALAPRGIGTMAAMLLVGRIGGIVDPRAAVLAGLAITGAALHAMTRFGPDTGYATIVGTGVLQGFGIGLIFPPLTAIAFASLEPRLRNDGTALFSLMRNIGSSIGISLVVSALARNTQANHEALAAWIDPSRLPLRLALESGAIVLDTPEGIAAIEETLARQASLIAYLQDFRLMAWICVAAMPLVLLLRLPQAAHRPRPRGKDG